MDPHTSARATTLRPARGVITMLAIAVLAVAACTSSGAASPSPTAPVADRPLEGTSWQLFEYVGAGGRAVAVPASVSVTATFDAGALSGNGGCNDYSATYALDGAKLTITEVQATLMACSGPASAVETPYLAILPLVSAFSITGDTLELQNAQGTITLRYRAAVAP
jgi:heat shock protein HslJ